MDDSLFKFCGELLEAGEGVLQALADVGSEFVRRRKVVEVGERTILDPEDVEARLVALQYFVDGEAAEAPIGVAFAPRLLPVVAVLRIVAADTLHRL